MNDHELKIYKAEQTLQAAMNEAGFRWEKRVDTYVDFDNGAYARVSIVTIYPRKSPTNRQVVCRINRRSAKVETPAFPANVINALRKIAAGK